MRFIKKLIIITALITYTFIMCACSKGDEGEINAEPNVVDIKNAIVTNFDFPEMVDATPDNILLMYDLDASTFDSYAVTYAGSGGSADEIAIIKLKTKDEVSDIKKVMENRIVNRTKAFQGYAPLESVKLGQAIVKTKGNYVFLAVCDDSEGAGIIFDESFK